MERGEIERIEVGFDMIVPGVVERVAYSMVNPGAGVAADERILEIPDPHADEGNLERYWREGCSRLMVEFGMLADMTYAGRTLEICENKEWFGKVSVSVGLECSGFLEWYVSISWLSDVAGLEIRNVEETIHLYFSRIRALLLWRPRPEKPD